MYKKLSRTNLRFYTEKGPLTIEQVWTLKPSVVANAIIEVKKLLKTDSADDSLAFLKESKPTPEDLDNQLRFEVLKDVYLTLTAEAEAAKKAKDDKEHNAKIYAKMAANNEKAMDGMSNEELEKQLR
jgi:hypothetical protein